MARELRKRNSVSEAQKSTVVKSAGKSPPKEKRKAAEDVSPVSVKKQKSSKKATLTDNKAAKKRSVPTKPKTGKKSEEDEQDRDEGEGGSVLKVDSDSDDEDAENVNKLAAKIDSGDEAPVDKTLSFKTGQSVGKIPSLSKELLKNAPKPSGEPGVIYIGRIPHGFYEHEMRQYLSQFGPVTRLRLSRNKKTGASKHFAFVEFEESSTAEIVAKTMDNYLLFGHILKCKIIPKEQIHEELFKGANKRFKAMPRNKIAGYKLQKPLSESAWKAKVRREKSKRTTQAAKLKEMGYDFDAPDLKNVPPPQAIENSVEEGVEEGVEKVKALEGTPAEEVKADSNSEAEQPKSTEDEKPAMAEDEPTVASKAKKDRAKKGKATKKTAKKTKA